MKRLIISLITIIPIVNLYSQNQDIAYPHIAPMSPNAAELAKYADSPVSYYSGTPDINIPLYEIDIDDFKLPITLNYHASGIRVDQEATWVGLGWSLDVGSTISRAVKSVDDFFIQSVDRNYPHCIAGYYDAPDISENLDNQYELHAYSGCFPVFAIFEYDLIYDPEPDIFYYTLPGISGKFILDKSRGAVLFDKSHNLKIEVIRNAEGSIGVKFKITDKEGNQYIYNNWEITKNYTSEGWLNKNSQTDDAVYDDSYLNFTQWTPFWAHPCNEEQSYDYYPSLQSPYPMVTSWCLSKVITKHGREINFTYDTETQYLPTQEASEDYRYPAPIGSDNYASALYYNKSKVVNIALRLNKIEGDFGRVEFNCSARNDIKGDSKKLDLISIYNNKNTLIKSYHFAYNYFDNDFSANPIYENVFKRLKLNNVTEYSSTDLPINGGYNIDYYEGDFPAKNSKNVDYWGFQNGKIYGQNYSIGLRLPNNINFNGVKKDMNFDKAIIGTLKKITYPTGGVAEYKFESNLIPPGYFETHTYEEPTADNTPPIDIPVYNYYSVNPFEDLPPPSSVYSFTVTAQTTLRITGSLENSGSPRDPNYHYRDAINNPLGKLRKISPTSSTLYTYQCPNIYSYPIYDLEEQGQGDEITLNDQEFTLEPGIYEFEAYTPPRDVLAYWRLFIRQEYVAPTGPYEAGGIRINEIKTDAKIRKFNYPFGTMTTEPILYYLGRRIGIPSVIDKCFVQVSESKTPLSTFNHGNFVGYDWVEEYMTDEAGNISKTKYTYHNDIESEVFDDDFPDSPRYINYSNGLIQSIEKYKNGTVVEKDDFHYISNYSGFIKAFKDKGQKKRYHDLLPFYYKVEWPLQSQVINTLKTDTGEDIILETNYSYNSKDLLDTSSYTLNGSQMIKYLKYPFDYSDTVNTGLVAKNMIGMVVNTQDFKDSEKLSEQQTIFKNWGGGLFAPEIIKTAKGVDATEDRLKYVSYDSVGNPLEVKKENGMSVSYIWGYNKTLPIAKIENITYSQVQSYESNLQSLSNTGTESDLITALNQLRTDLTNAMVTTYTYIPLVGVSTMTDPKGDRQTFSYDSAGRLQSVTDADNNVLSENEYHYRTQN